MTSFIQTQTITDPIAIPSLAKFTIKQNKRNHIAGCLDSRHRRLSKNRSADSKLLFGNYITKRMMTITTNKKPLSNKSISFTTSSSSLLMIPSKPWKSFQNISYNQAKVFFAKTNITTSSRS